MAQIHIPVKKGLFRYENEYKCARYSVAAYVTIKSSKNGLRNCLIIRFILMIYDKCWRSHLPLSRGAVGGVIMADQKLELLRMLKGKSVKRYHFSLQEDGNKEVTSLTNSAVRKPIHLKRVGADLILSYTQVKDKKKRTTRTFKSEVKTSGSNVAIIVKDLVTNRVISKNSFPSPTPHDHPGDTGFETLQQCIQDFRCKHGGELQCEANRTCKTQFAALTCCLNNGNCFSVHLVFHPNSLRCQILSNVPQLEGLVLSQAP
jgi:hypothetical protein